LAGLWEGGGLVGFGERESGRCAGGRGRLGEDVHFGGGNLGLGKFKLLLWWFGGAAWALLLRAAAAAATRIGLQHKKGCANLRTDLWFLRLSI